MVAAIVASSMVAYGWDLDAQGWSDPYYTAVVQAGQQSWSSFWFGSLEVGNAMASDKPPVAFWVMALSARAFGLSSWSVLLPEVVETAGTTLLIYGAVRMVAGRTSGAVAALVFATTPVVLVLARYNLPDTMMTFLVVAAAYCALRATRSPRWGWVAASGVGLGLAFLTKWAVSLLPAPAFAAALFMGAPGSARGVMWHRWRRVVLFAAAMAITAMSWVVPVLLVPARARPYADGSGGNLASLILGRDGFSRLGGTGGAGTAHVAGTPSPWRLLVPPFGPQVGWLLPLALGLAMVVAVTACRGRDTDGSPTPALGRGPLWLISLGWLVTCVGVFSVMTGPMHPYYTVLLAPAAAMVIALGLADLRQRGWLRLASVPIAATVVYQLVLVRGVQLPSRSVLEACLAVLLATAAGAALTQCHHARARTPALLIAPLLVLPLAFGLTTDSHPVRGYDPLAGPLTAVATNPYPDRLTRFLHSHQGGRLWLAAVPRATAASILQLQTGSPVLPLGGFTGHAGGPTIGQVRDWVESDRLRYLVLPHAYTAYPHDTPPALEGYPVAAILKWAKGNGCPQQTGDSSFVVLDLDSDGVIGIGRACP